ncbi:PREDICTED: uncharacterized protein LOC106307054 isoform X1 [Brassica oleracea var. oleracea]|uniref:uncharacterized protein LOC106307054 isoform X1 n=1 Tax=Brassica oleracea var. oleracea TaxID=109376 RepID=UPI0006A72236|nr:PREDICTED: uncharacterized protein LOC106307054 isoform X1 [Brassica oleracea var. oleracea]
MDLYCKSLFSRAIYLLVYIDVLFAESLYGLRRKSIRLRLRKGSSKEVQRFGLEKRQRVSLFFFWLCYSILYQSCMVYITRKGKRCSGRVYGDQRIKGLMKLTSLQERKPLFQEGIVGIMRFLFEYS